MAYLFIIFLLCRLDCAYIFKYQVSAIEEYCTMFPQPTDQIDLVKLQSQCKAGRFNDTQGKPFSGLLLLFSELDVMVRNCKEFNAVNRDFQPWRCADMMETELFDLQDELACIHHIDTLQEVVEKSWNRRIQEESRYEEDI